MGKDFFVVLPLHTRIALLTFAEQAFFGREQRSSAVYVDRATFEHDALLAEEGTDFTGVGGVRHVAADFFVALEVGIFGPGVEAPFDSQKAVRLSRRHRLRRMVRERAIPLRSG